MNYNEKREQRYMVKLNELMDALPNICRTFFIGIENRTSVRTRIAYAYDLKLFFYYLIVKLNKSHPITYETLDGLSSTDIEEYLHWLSGYEIDGVYYANDESAKSRKLSSLKTFYKYNLKKGNITTNPLFAVENIKIHEKEIIRLNPDEKDCLVETVITGNGLTKKQKESFEKNKIRDYAILITFLETGMRISELTGIDIDDIEFNQHKINIIRKGGNYAAIYISDRNEEILKEYIELYRSPNVLDDEKALFITLAGRRMSVRAIEAMIKKYARTTALPKITPHKLRATYGTDLYNITGDISLVAENLGHKSINTTKNRYAGVSDTRKRLSRNILEDADKNKNNSWQ